MKHLLLLTLIIVGVGCSDKWQRHKDIDKKLRDDFFEAYIKGMDHQRRGNLDSAYYYGGVLDYNLKLRDYLDK